ncbi:hypothetical protein ACMG4P_22050 [Pseudovibrio denitrificans]|uniref:hypothetical protein n=1 Tax=Pseudovibrio denitrificans TaxID=258256 RepID=UPI0039BFE03C
MEFDFREFILYAIPIILTIYLAHWGIKKKKLSYSTASFTISGENNPEFPSDLSILYDGHVVNNLTSTTIVIWNSGNETISDRDKLDRDLLRLELPPENKILSAITKKQSKITNECNPFSLPGIDNTAYINFKHLEPGDGARILVIHDGEKNSLNVKGSLIGIKGKMKEVYSRDMQVKGKKDLFKKNKILSYVMILVGFLFLSIAGSFSILPDVTMNLINSSSNLFPTTPRQTMQLAFGFIGAAYLAVPLIYLTISRSKFPKQLSED